MPTRSSKRPEGIMHAKVTDKLINENLQRNDSDRDANDDDADGDVIEHLRRRSTAIHTAIAHSDRSESPQRRRLSGAQNAELVEKFPTPLNPDTQRARGEERANRSLHTTQIFTFTQQPTDPLGPRFLLWEIIFTLSVSTHTR